MGKLFRMFGEEAGKALTGLVKHPQYALPGGSALAGRDIETADRKTGDLLKTAAVRGAKRPVLSVEGHREMPSRRLPNLEAFKAYTSARASAKYRPHPHARLLAHFDTVRTARRSA